MAAHHVIPPRTYFVVFAALIAFTILTVGIDMLERYRYFSMAPVLHTVVSLTIAVIKASLVILFFMHIWYSRWLNWLVAAGSLLWLGILISYSLTDYVTREWIHVPGH